MSGGEFLAFNEAWMRAVFPHLDDGGLLGTFINWRGYPTTHAAAMKLGLAPLNLIVWAKTNGGMGSLYRSQHELLPRDCHVNLAPAERESKGSALDQAAVAARQF
jgi:DNA modification methylase